MIAVLYHLRDEFDCEYTQITLAMISCIFQISEESCRDLVAIHCIRYEESIYCWKRMWRISPICCNVSLTWLRAVKRPRSDKDVTRMMHVGRERLLVFCRILYSVAFSFWHDIYLELGRYMSLFECKRSDSVLYNVILITRGTIFFTPQNAQLLTRCKSIGISKVACWGREYA